MPFNIFDTHHLLMAVEQLTPAPSFLLNRYFPTNAATDVFSTDDVLVEYKDGSKKLAPFVAPRKGGVTILRNGYTMERYTPPFVAPRRALTIDDLNKKGFGEALYSQLTPAQRQQVLLMKDASELGDFITRREEAMAAEVMLTGGCVMKHIADDAAAGDEMEIRFYTGEANPSSYNPDTKWGEANADIIGDLDQMIQMLTKKGLRASELVCSPDVADAIVSNEKIQKLLDIRNYNVGEVNPVELPAGAAIVAKLNVRGRIISIISYDETYTDDAGDDHLFIPSGKCVLTAPAAGRTLYGAVSQVEQNDGAFHTYTGKRVPKYISNAEGNTRSLTISSRPLPMPNAKGSFISADVL